MMKFDFGLFAGLLALVLLQGCQQEASQAESSNAAEYVLAFSWQPAFCEGAERKRECKTQKPDRFDAIHFSLHGLWPQPGSKIYCNVSEQDIAADKRGDWRSINTRYIDKPLWDKLRPVMPGTRSALHKHEWIKHGTCYGGDINKYYEDSLWLMKKINASALQKLFAENIGIELGIDQIKSAFGRDFGKSAGARLRMSCKRDQDSGRQLIVELTLGLKGSISSDANFSDLVAAAPPTKQGCPAGIVDPVGLQ